MISNFSVNNIVLFLLVAFICAIYLAAGDMFLYDIWADRELVRANAIPHEWFYTSAELSNAEGARTPGGLIYYVLALLMVVSNDPAWLYFSMMLLNALACYVLFKLVKDDFGLTAGLFAASLYIASDILSSMALQMWNPTLMPLPFMLGVYYGYKAVVHGKSQSLKWMFFWVGIAVQFHVTALIFLFLVLIYHGAKLLYLRRKPSLLNGLVCIIFLLLPLLPYIIGDAVHGFTNTRGIMAATASASGVSEQSSLALNMSNIRFFRDSVLLGKVSPLQFNRVLSNLHIAFVLFAACWLTWNYCLRFRKVRESLLTPRQWDALGFFLLPVACIFVTYAFVAEYSISQAQQRYIYIALPSMCGFIAALFFVFIKFTERYRWSKVLLVITLTLWSGNVAYASYYKLVPLKRETALPVSYFNFRGQTFMYQDIKQFIADIQKVTGWPLQEIQYRVMKWDFVPYIETVRPQGGWYWGPRYGINYIINRDVGVPSGRHVKGSVYQTGGIYIYGARQHSLTPEDITPSYIRKTLAQDVGDLTVDARYAFGDNIFVVYTRRDGGVVPSSLQNRYNMTPEEEYVEKYRNQVAKGSAKLISHKDNQSDYILNLDNNILILLRLVYQEDGKTRIELHSNPLRGHAPAASWLSDAMIKNPRLVVQGKDILLHKGLVGHMGVMTPLILESTHDLQAADTITFATDIVSGVAPYLWPMPDMELETVKLDIPASMQ